MIASDRGLGGIVVYKNKLSIYQKNIIPFSPEDQLIAQNVTNAIARAFQITEAQEKQIEFFRIAKHEISNAEKVVSISCKKLEEATAEENLLQAIEDIRHNTYTMSAFLINADIRGLHIEPEFSQVVKPFGDIIIKWMKSYKLKFRNKGVGYYVPDEEEYRRILPWLTIKKDHLDLLFFNLIGNAFKYCLKYSNVGLSIHQENEAEISLSLVNYAKPWLPEETPHLFLKEFRGANAPSIDEGMGIGLFVVDKIAKAYGIKVEALEPVELSRFSLPAAHLLLSKYEPGELGLSEDEANKIKQDLANLSESDEKKMFVNPNVGKLCIEPFNVGPFSRLLIDRDPTYRIEFRITIPANLFDRRGTR